MHPLSTHPEPDFSFPLERCEQVPPGLVFLWEKGGDEPFMITTLKELGVNGPDVGWKATLEPEVADEIRRKFRESGAESFSMGAVEIATQSAAEGLAMIAQRERSASMPAALQALALGTSLGASLSDALALSDTLGDMERMDRFERDFMARVGDIEPDLRPINPVRSGRARGVPNSRSGATKRKRNPAKVKAAKKRAKNAHRKNR